MSLSLPGNVSILWGLVYMLAGYLLLPMILGFVAGKRSTKTATAAS